VAGEQNCRPRALVPTFTRAFLSVTLGGLSGERAAAGAEKSTAGDGYGAVELGRETTVSAGVAGRARGYGDGETGYGSRCWSPLTSCLQVPLAATHCSTLQHTATHCNTL